MPQLKMEFFYDIFEYQYLANALLAAIFAGITCGIVGTYVVARRMVFLCGGITHASFGGLGIALYAGVNPIGGALIFATLSAMGIEWASDKGKIREDSAIGIIWSIGMAIGAGMYFIGIITTLLIVILQIVLHTNLLYQAFHQQK